MADPAARRHHFIPRWHLAGFSPDGTSPPSRRTLARYSKSRDIYEALNVGNAAVRNDFYSVTGPDEVVDRGFETDVTAPIDAAGAKSLRRFISGEALVGQIRTDAAAYLALLQGRTPIHADGLKMAMETAYTLLAPGRLGTDEAAFLRDARVAGADEPGADLLAWRADMLEGLAAGDIKIGPAKPPAAFTASVALDGTAHIFEHMHWSLWRTVGPAEFVLSDSGIVLAPGPESRKRSEEAGFDLGFALATPDVEVMVPLTRHAALMATHEQVLPPKVEASSVLAEAVNVHSWQASQEYVFGSSERILRAVAAELARRGGNPRARAGWSVSGGGLPDRSL